MKKSAPPRRRRRTLLLTVLLAVLCVGFAELAACAHFAPALYQRLTAPARRGAEAAAQVCAQAASAVSRASESAHRRVCRHVAAAEPLAVSLWARLTEPKEEVPPPPEQDSQLAGEPELDEGAPAADPAVTELNVINGQEILTGGTIPIVYFNQGSERWAEQPYGTDDIGRYGCGPTAMAMVVSSMTDTPVDPLEMARLAAARGHWAKRSGSNLSIVEDLSAQAGLSAVPIRERSADALTDALLSGSLLVALMGPGHFTKGGHFIVLRGVTLSGTVLVADPNSSERSLMEWDPELIVEELSRSTAHGAPLWVISQDSPIDAPPQA